MHTKIQGPHDNYICKECTNDLIHDLRVEDTFDEQLIGNYDQAYVPYPCPTIKENNNA
jgi:hypothetical protein